MLTGEHVADHGDEIAGVGESTTVLVPTTNEETHQLSETTSSSPSTHEDEGFEQATSSPAVSKLPEIAHSNEEKEVNTVADEVAQTQETTESSSVPVHHDEMVHSSQVEATTHALNNELSTNVQENEAEQDQEVVQTQESTSISQGEATNHRDSNGLEVNSQVDEAKQDEEASQDQEIESKSHTEPQT